MFTKKRINIQFCMSGYTWYAKDHKQIIKTLFKKIEWKKIKYAWMNLIIYKGSSINNSWCFIL